MANAMENKYGFAEVVDTFSDAIEIGTAVENAISDGVQFTDLFAVYQQYPKAKEIYDEFEVFRRQFLDLTPEESRQAFDQIAERTGVDKSVVQGKALLFLSLAGRGYRLVDYALKEATAIAQDAKDLLKPPAAAVG